MASDAKSILHISPKDGLAEVEEKLEGYRQYLKQQPEYTPARHDTLEVISSMNPDPATLSTAFKNTAKPQVGRVLLEDIRGTRTREVPRIQESDLLQETTRIRLVEALNNPGDGALPVWRGEILGSAFSDTPHVAVKFYVEDVESIPPAHHLTGNRSSCFRTASEQLIREFWAYQQASCLQGSVLPKSFGFYTVKGIDGIAVPCHIMENINATNFEKTTRKLRWADDPNTLKPKFIGLFKAAEALLQCQVIWWGRYANVLEVQDGIVFVSFGGAMPVSEVRNASEPGEVDDGGPLRLKDEAERISGICDNSVKWPSRGDFRVWFNQVVRKLPDMKIYSDVALH